MRIVQWAFPMVSTYGGRENFVLNLAKDLRQVGDQVSVLAIDPELDQPEFVDTEISGELVRHIGVAGLVTRRQGIFQELFGVFEAELKQFNPDVIHAHNPEGPDLILLRALAKLINVPVVMTIHGPLLSSTEAARSAIRLTEQLSKYVVAVSDFFYKNLLAQYPNLSSKLQLVVNGAPRPLSSAQNWRDNEKIPPTIYASGRLSAEKGFAQLLSAFSIVKQVVPDAQLTIAGEGPDAALLRQFASNLGLEDCVHFPGWLSPQQVASHLASARMVVVPSVWQEPFGLVAVEAMQASLPVIASNRGALPEIVRHQNTGLIFESGDIFELASSIRLFLDEPETAQIFGARGKDVASAKFNQRRCTLEYQRLYFSASGRTLNFSIEELEQLGAAGNFNFFPTDFGLALQLLPDLERVRDELAKSNSTTVCKLTHDDHTPLPAEITDLAPVFRTSMLSNLSYPNEFPLPVLVSGGEYSDWKPVARGTLPQVGFVGWAQAELFHRAISERAPKDVSQIGLQEINQTQANLSLLRQPVNIGLILRKRAIATLGQSELVATEFLIRQAYHFDGRDDGIQAQRRNEYLDNLKRNPYSLCIRGAGNFSIRLYETLAAGRIPVIVNTALVLPLDGLVPWRDLGVWVELEELSAIDQKIDEYHQQLSEEQFLERQRDNQDIWRRYLAPNTFWRYALSDLNTRADT